MSFKKLLSAFLVVFAVLAGAATIGRSSIASHTTMMAEGSHPPPPPWKPLVA